MLKDLIKEFCENNEDKYSYYDNYSGRFMFGRRCPAIIVKQGNSYLSMMMELTIYLDSFVDDIVLDAFEGLAIDELGLNIIVYFPNYKEI